MTRKKIALQVRDIPEDQIKRLNDIAKLNGFSSVSDYLRWLIEAVTSEIYIIKSEIRYQEVIDQYKNLLEVTLKKLDDVDEIMKKITEEKS